MVDIYDIVQDEIFDLMDNTVKIISASVLSGEGTQLIELCANKWIRVGQSMTDIYDKEWIIQSISSIGLVTVLKPTGGSDLERNDILTIKSPKFLFGTHRSADDEYKDRVYKDADNRNQLPLIWLVESISETEYDYTKTKERDSDIRLYFLDDNNPEEYMNDDYRRNVVSPMIGLKDEFIRVVQNNILFDKLVSWKTRPITRFGNEDEKGYFENILSDNFSGVELRVTLPIFKTTRCKC